MRLSVVLTTHNHAASLPGCLAALNASLLPGDEVIALDARSSDGSVPLLKNHRPRAGVKWQTLVLGSRPRIARAVALNIGLSMASRPAVLMLDGDEQLLPDGLAEARQALIPGNDLAIMGFEGPFATAEAPHWTAGADRQAALRMEAQAGRLLFRLDGAAAKGLRLPETAACEIGQALHWQLCAQARALCFSPKPALRAGLAKPADAGVLAVVFSDYRQALTRFPSVQTALTARLEHLVDRHLRALPSEAYWTYAEAAGPLPDAARTASPGSGLYALALNPRWHAVAQWHEAALLGQPASLPEARTRAINRATALWRGWRGSKPSA